MIGNEPEPIMSCGNILLRFLKILLRFLESHPNVDIIWCQYFCITLVREWARSYSGIWKDLTKIFENLTKIFEKFTEIFRISSKCRYHLVPISCLNSEPTACWNRFRLIREILLRSSKILVRSWIWTPRVSPIDQESNFTWI